MTTPPPAPPAGRITRLTDGLLILIVLAVGAMAGAASFRHVHDWTMHNSPTATADWFGWANAVITELIPTAALIIIARRRRTPAGHTAYPMFLLIAAVTLSLTAQLAVARPTVFGWMVSALPSLAFFALSKLVFTATKQPTVVTVPDTAPAPVDPQALEALTARLAYLETRPTQASTHPPSRPVAAPSFDIATDPAPTRVPTTPEPRIVTQPSEPAVTATLAPPVAPAPVRPAVTAPNTAPAAAVNTHPDPVAAVLPGARQIATHHHAAHGTPINRGQLAARLHIPTTLADQVLAVLGQDPTRPEATTHVNGKPVLSA